MSDRMQRAYLQRQHLVFVVWDGGGVGGDGGRDLCADSALVGDRWSALASQLTLTPPKHT